MNINRKSFFKNIVDQIKEAQIKLGFEKETTRLYYPTASLNAILGTDAKNAREMVSLLSDTFAEADPDLGQLTFAVSAGRVEVSVPPEGAVYVHENVADSPFLIEIISLFGDPHHVTLDKIKEVFAKYDPEYHFERMPEGTDFDYAFSFSDPEIDEYFYCVKDEMGHMIYHRFSKADYLVLL